MIFFFDKVWWISSPVNFELVSRWFRGWCKSQEPGTSSILWITVSLRTSHGVLNCFMFFFFIFSSVRIQQKRLTDILGRPLKRQGQKQCPLGIYRCCCVNTVVKEFYWKFHVLWQNRSHIISMRVLSENLFKKCQCIYYVDIWSWLFNLAFIYHSTYLSFARITYNYTGINTRIYKYKNKWKCCQRVFTRCQGMVLGRSFIVCRIFSPQGAG